jgi:site-specific recombinase XerD
MWTAQITSYLHHLTNPSTRTAYEVALRHFGRWYEEVYGQTPDATLLTPEEGYEWRTYLSQHCGLSAATTNQRLAALRSLARYFGHKLLCQDIKRVTPPLEPLRRAK